ncbi:hypothetical protein PYCC9005_005910 [Savitreella phatthalungensis]
MAPVLGYVEPLESDSDRQEVIADIFTSRVGGPVCAFAGRSWGTPPRCGKCQRPLALLLQLSAPEGTDRPDAYARVIYVLTCTDNRCATAGWSPSLKVFRAQADKATSKKAVEQHDFVGEGASKSFAPQEIVSEVEPAEPADGKSKKPSSSQEFAPLMAENDGTETYQKVGGDAQFYRFERRLARAPEQVLRYLRVEERPSKRARTIPPPAPPAQTAALPQTVSRADGAAGRVKAAQKANGTINNEDEDEWSDDDDGESELIEGITGMMDADEARGALWISSAGKLPSSDVPTCPRCKGKRSLECQILPTLLNYLPEVDPLDKYSLDFGLLNIYTCDAACPIGEELVEEAVWRQEYDIKTSIF